MVAMATRITWEALKNTQAASQASDIRLCGNSHISVFFFLIIIPSDTSPAKAEPQLMSSDFYILSF